LLILLVIAFLVLIAMCVLLVAIIVSLAGRMIEIFMYLSIAPIPMATFMNSEWRSMGNNWLRGVFALAFQAFFIVVSLAIFTALFGDIVNNINGSGAGVGIDVIFQMLILLSYTVALIFTVLRSGSISKSIFGAS
jgi:hypothetical protein